MNFPFEPKNMEIDAIENLLSTGLAHDDLRFAILDQTPGKGSVYIIDPITLTNREAWVVQLREIQQMQQNFLMALQDPRRFNKKPLDDVWSRLIDFI